MIKRCLEEKNCETTFSTERMTLRLKVVRKGAARAVSEHRAKKRGVFPRVKRAKVACRQNGMQFGWYHGTYTFVP